MIKIWKKWHTIIFFQQKLMYHLTWYCKFLWVFLLLFFFLMHFNFALISFLYQVYPAETSYMYGISGVYQVQLFLLFYSQTHHYWGNWIPDSSARVQRLHVMWSCGIPPARDQLVQTGRKNAKVLSYAWLI